MGKAPGAGRHRWTRRPLAVLAGLGIAAAMAGASAGQPAATGTITLRAAVLDISAAGIVATGAPTITSSQGVLAAQHFSVTLDRQGRATLATATGDVRFTLNAAAGAYRTMTGSCGQLVLHPAEKQAVLLGGVHATLEGPGARPVQMAGVRAVVYAATPSHAAHISVEQATGIVPERT